ncbi:MAG: antibiotic biosynthesis monooxygenase [Pseudonocardia sp.]|nr:antibiotic biosynthesis monooxygenase [Pseudonocardia sp.]
MLVVHVHVHVKPEHLEAFLVETRRNAAFSLAEPGVRRFDVLQAEGDDTHVVLTEVYVDQSAADAHKQTAHYARWRDEVAEMLAEPRASTRFASVFPAEDGW